jgi:hypothetical protein
MAIGLYGPAITGDLDPTDVTSPTSVKLVDETGIPSGGHVSPLFATFETLVADTVTETAIISIGTNYPDYDNILPGYGVCLVQGSVETVPIQRSQMVNDSTDIYARVVRVATASDMQVMIGLGFMAYVPT